MRSNAPLKFGQRLLVLRAQADGVLRWTGSHRAAIGQESLNRLNQAADGLKTSFRTFIALKIYFEASDAAPLACFCVK